MLEELRSLSEENKKRVLIIATVIIMVIVIGAWAVYFNSIVMGTAQQAATDATSSAAVASPSTTTVTATAPATAQANSPSLWQNIKDGFGSIANIIKKPSQYTIQPKK
jgi:flagellar basal body-associated protein FliL